MSPALLKKLAFKGTDFPDADKKIKTAIPLADALKQFPLLKKAWEKGRLLYNIGQQAEGGATIAEAENNLGIESGTLARILAEDAEAADIWTQKRLKSLGDFKKILADQAREGKVAAINNFINILRAELSNKKHIDFHRVTQNQMEKELGVGRQNLHNWSKGQGLQRNRDGTIDLAVFIPWLEEYSAARATRGAGKAPKDDDQRAIRAKIMRLNLERQQGSLLEQDKVLAGLLARHQTMLAAFQKKTEELARLVQAQPFEKAKEILAAGFDEICRDMCTVPPVLRLPAEAAEKFMEILAGLKPEDQE